MQKPEKPVEPDPDSCCGSGCLKCVYDIYNEELEEYDEDLKKWEE